VIDVFAEAAWLNVLPDDQSRDLIRHGVVSLILIPGDDQEALVRESPPGIGGEVKPEPLVTLENRSIVHVVIEIRDDPANGRQSGEVTREAAEIFLYGDAFRETFPGVVLPRR